MQLYLGRRSAQTTEITVLYFFEKIAILFLEPIYRALILELEWSYSTGTDLDEQILKYEREQNPSDVSGAGGGHTYINT
jgi:hypothetical protein